MPFTFLAHQAPVMGLASRRSTKVDGLALVVGSMAPDLVEVPLGIESLGVPLFLDGHHLVGQPLLAVFAVGLTVLVRLVVLPVAPLVLPDRLGDLRDALLWASTSRPRIWTTYWCALVGALTHIVLDLLFAGDGLVFVDGVEFFRESWITIAGRKLPNSILLQVGFSLVLGMWAIAVLWKWARRTRPERNDRLAPLGKGFVVLGVVVGGAAGIPIALARHGYRDWQGEQIRIGMTDVAITWWWVVFFGLLVGCLAARGQQQLSPGSDDDIESDDPHIGDRSVSGPARPFGEHDLGRQAR